MSSGTSGGAAPALPPGWTLQVSRSTGQQYYFNHRTGESSYIFPGTVAPAAAVAAASPAASTDTVASSSAEDSRASKRPRPADATVPGTDAKALAVANAYDALQEMGVEGRKGSSIFHLKSFNNWVKATLIAEYAPRPCHRVLDLACGKLGDLLKWRAAGVRSYCGVDISLTGLRDARKRFNDVNARDGGITAKLIRADLGVTDLAAAGALSPDEQFDAISIQFALHYMFQSEQRALTFFANIAGRLAPGGVLLVTLPDSDVLVRRTRDLPPHEHSFGNVHYRITMPHDSVKRMSCLGTSPYGCVYNFYLTESVDHVDEYLVPNELLTRLAMGAGLVPIASANFHEFFEAMHVKQRHAESLQRMSVLNCDGTMTPEEWEVAGVYRIVAFRAPPTPVPSRLPALAELVPGQVRIAPAHGMAYKANLDEADILDVLGSAA